MGENILNVYEQLSFPVLEDRWIRLTTTTDYFINRHGQVKRGFHILKPVKLKSGYCQVSINGNKRYVHRLMAKAFYGQIKDNEEPDHLNGVRHDNRIENLELVSHAENLRRRGKASYNLQG
jgi:hypothetical protein